MATPKIVADFETQLASAVSVGATSFTLASATDDDGTALPAGKYYFTIENGTSKKEYVVGTVSGTAVSSVSTVSRQGTETSGIAIAHRAGASVIITDWKTYKDYMDEIALVSAPDADTNTKGVVEGATLAEVRARTPSGGTGAALVVTPDVCDDLPTSDEKAALVGTSGTPSTSNKFVTADDVATDGTAGKIIRANSSAYPTGLTAISRKLVFDLTTSDPIGTGTEEKTVTSQTIPANSLGTANAVKFKLYIQDYSTAASDYDATFRVKLGSTTLATFTPAGTAGAIGPFAGFIEGVIFANASTSAQFATVHLFLANTSLDADGTATHMNDVVTGTATEDSTGALTLAITAQYAGSNSNNNCTRAGFIMELVS